jgi:ADP-ribose pyrophosphatase YjhB (NUDIX family)
MSLVEEPISPWVSSVDLDKLERLNKTSIEKHKKTRHRFWRPGSWGLPSGYANRNEKLEDTLRREVREETGYEVVVSRLLRMVSGYRLRLEVSYLGHLTGGQFRLDPKEVIEARFFSLGELPEGLLPSHRDIITLAFSDAPEKNVSSTI